MQSIGHYIHFAQVLRFRSQLCGSPQACWRSLLHGIYRLNEVSGHSSVSLPTTLNAIYRVNL